MACTQKLPLKIGEHFLFGMRSYLPDERWDILGVNQQKLDEVASYISERRSLTETSILFHFENAGELMRHSWYYYPFASLAFFHAVLGIERSFQILYESKNKPNFSRLFVKAVKDGLVQDSDFSSLPQTSSSQLPKSYSEILSAKIPKIRNGIAHGAHALTAELIPITRNCRDLVDGM